MQNDLYLLTDFKADDTRIISGVGKWFLKSPAKTDFGFKQAPV